LTPIIGKLELWLAGKDDDVIIALRFPSRFFTPQEMADAILKNLFPAVKMKLTAHNHCNSDLVVASTPTVRSGNVC